MTTVLDLVGMDTAPSTAPMPDDGDGLEWAWACRDWQWHPMRTFGSVLEVIEKQPETHGLEFQHALREAGTPWAQVAPTGSLRLTELGILGEDMPRVAYHDGSRGGPVRRYPAA